MKNIDSIPEVCLCGHKIIVFEKYWVCSNRWCDNRGEIPESDPQLIYNANVVKSQIKGDKKMKFFNEQGKLSKTIVLGIVQVLVSVLLAAATWIQAGDFSTASILVFVSGVLTIVLRHYTDSPLV